MVAFPAAAAVAVTEVNSTVEFPQFFNFHNAKQAMAGLAVMIAGLGQLPAFTAVLGWTGVDGDMMAATVHPGIGKQTQSPFLVGATPIAEGGFGFWFEEFAGFADPDVGDAEFQAADRRRIQCLDNVGDE